MVDLLNIDCSPSKKYTKWLIKQYKNEKFDIKSIKSYIDEYHTLTIRGLINSDIYSFKSLKEFKDKIDQVNNITTNSRKESENNYDVLIDNDDILVIRPNSHAASRKLGLSIFKHRNNKKTGHQDSAWCTTYATDSHWNDYYYSKDVTFYYIKLKKIDINSDNKNFRVFACAVLPSYSIEIYDADDILSELTASEILEQCNIKMYNLNSFIIPHNTEKRHWDNHKRYLKLLNNEVIDGDLYLTPKSLASFDIEVNCKKIIGNLIICDGFFEIPKFIKKIKVYGSLKIKNNILIDLEGLPKFISKHIICNSNKLSSLKGAPKIVHGDFFCDDNYLTTLEHVPEIIKGSFTCNNNEIINLNYFPKEIGLDVDISSNNLKSLKGIISEVNGRFICDSNKLTSLEYAPQIVHSDFICSTNYLTSLEHVPLKIGRSFICSGNDLSSLIGAPKKVYGIFDCSHNNLVNLTGAPEYVKDEFNCQNNSLESLIGSPFIEPDGSFYCSYNNLKTLKGAPSKIKYFYCIKNDLTSLKYSPIEALHFHCGYNKLKNLKGCPQKLEYFSCYENKIKSFDDYPVVSYGTIPYSLYIFKNKEKNMYSEFTLFGNHNLEQLIKSYNDYYKDGVRIKK